MSAISVGFAEKESSLPLLPLVSGMEAVKIRTMVPHLSVIPTGFHHMS